MQKTPEYQQVTEEEETNREKNHFTEQLKRKAAIQQRIATYLNLYNS